MTDIVDRVGTGDAFAAGLIQGVLTEMPPLSALKSAAAASCLMHSIPGDVNRCSVADVQALMAGGGAGRIQCQSGQSRRAGKKPHPLAIGACLPPEATGCARPFHPHDRQVQRGLFLALRDGGWPPALPWERARRSATPGGAPACS